MPSVLLVTAAAFAIVGGLVTVAVVEAKGLAGDLREPENQQRLDAKLKPVRAGMHRLESIKSGLKSSAPATTRAVGQAAAADGVKPATPVVMQSPGESSLAWLPEVAGSVLEGLVNAVMIVVLTLFLLIQREQFRDRLIRLAGRSRLSSTTRALADAADRVGQYLLLQLAVNATLGLVIGTGLWLMGVPYAALWGLGVTVLRFIPYVGYWVAAVGAIGAAGAFTDGWGHAIGVFALFAAFDLIMANVVEPLIFSHGTGVSPVALLVAAVFWAFLWGPVGLLLSTPLTVCLAVLGKHVPALGFMAIVLGDEPSLDMAAKFYNRLLARDYDEAAVLVDGYKADHPPAQLYDEVFLPALAQVKTDREQNDVTADEERAVYDATRSVLDGMGVNPGDGGQSDGDRLRVIGCAVFGPADELALRMLGDAIGPAGGELVVTTPDEVVAEVGRSPAGKPAVACFSTLSPGGLSQARAIIGRVKQAHPSVKLLVGRWGQSGDTAQTEKYLRGSGADDVGWSLRETIGQLIPAPAETVRLAAPATD